MLHVHVHVVHMHMYMYHVIMYRVSCIMYNVHVQHAVDVHAECRVRCGARRGARYREQCGAAPPDRGVITR